MTVTVTTSLTVDMQRADDVGALPRPAGVALVIDSPVATKVTSGGDIVLSGSDTISN